MKETEALSCHRNQNADTMHGADSLAVAGIVTVMRCPESNVAIPQAQLG